MLTVYKNKKIKFIQLVNTVKYLQWSQIGYRLYYSFAPLRLTSQVNYHLRDWLTFWQAPAQNKSPSIISLNEVFFLGEKGNLQDPGDWNCSLKSKLWLYNLHYFDDLNHEP
jgi:hypothetical protein